MDKLAQLRCDVAVVGAGPAGIAAALTAAESGSKVALLDDNAWAGGQIWRGGATVEGQPDDVVRRFDRLSKSGGQFLGGARVFHAQAGILEAETDRSLLQIQFGKLIVATGAREVFLPFPGWTQPNVVGAGGLQALVKSGLPIKGKRVVVAATAPMSYAFANKLLCPIFCDLGSACLRSRRRSGKPLGCVRKAVVLPI
jgi:D-hydroxyproline dehydrogenase subunit alpha